MKIVKYILIVVLVLAVIAAIAAPLGPLPGFFIGGTDTPAPASWADTSSTHEIKLKVPGTPPRVVILWVIQHDEELHVVGAKDSGWVTKLGNGGPVELRLNDSTHPLTASLMSENWHPVLAAYIDKYRPDYPDIVDGFPSMEEAEELIAVYRLNR